MPESDSAAFARTGTGASTPAFPLWWACVSVVFLHPTVPTWVSCGDYLAYADVPCCGSLPALTDGCICRADLTSLRASALGQSRYVSRSRQGALLLGWIALVAYRVHSFARSMRLWKFRAASQDVAKDDDVALVFRPMPSSTVHTLACSYYSAMKYEIRSFCQNTSKERLHWRE